VETTKEIQKVLELRKTTHSRRRVLSAILNNSVRNDVHSFQHLPKALEHLLVGQLKGRDHTRRILHPRVLKTKVFSLLKRLDSTAKKTRNNTKAGQTLLFQSTYPLNKRLDCLVLILHQEFLFPSIVNRGTRRRMDGKRRNYVGGVKPLGTPIPHRVN